MGNDKRAIERNMWQMLTPEIERANLRRVISGFDNSPSY
jgi:hypothetical protein